MAPEISLRKLGHSTNFSRPNDLLWMVTMNSTRTSPDLASRALPIRLSYSGDPKNRSFGGLDPVDFAMQNRLPILGELAGMIRHWNQTGRQVRTARHRCSHWAEIIGGILNACGFQEFLMNASQAAASFNSDADDLAALAEAAAEAGGAYAVVVNSQPGAGQEAEQQGCSAKDWANLFVSAHVRTSEIRTYMSTQAKVTKIGQFFGALVGREVLIQTGGKTGRAVLRQVKGRSRTSLYFFEIRLDEDEAPKLPSQEEPEAA